VVEAAAAGRLDLVLVMSEPVPGLDAARLGCFTAVHTPFAAEAAHGDLVLPAAAYGEFDGTWINFQERAQRVRRALTPPGIALEAWRLASELMMRLGIPAAWASQADVLGEIASRVPSLQGLAGRPIGPLGKAL